MGRKKRGPPTPWEIAKPILEKDYLEGRVKDTMFPRDVRMLRPQYMLVKAENFSTNLRAMKKRIGLHKNRSIQDKEAFIHDTSLYELAVNDSFNWDGSAAQCLLMVDVKAGMHRLLKPKALRLLRPEYQEFDLDVFRAHIYQEARSELETPYWMSKKKKKAIRWAERFEVEEDDVDFFDDASS